MLITRTPLRIGLFGGGTDFPGYFKKEDGCVINTAINKYIYVVIKPRIDNKTRVSCTHIQTVNHIENIKHDLIREAIKKTNMPGGVEIITIGDVPAGTGLGSSSSVTVGLLKAMHEYTRNPVDNETLAQEACDIEINILKHPIGVQDQYAAAFGGFRFIEFKKNGDVVLNKPSFYRDFNDRLMLFYTGIVRKAEDVLTEQTKKIFNNMELLTQVKEIAVQANNSLLLGDYDTVGYLLHETWKIKKQLASGITTKKIDSLYKMALDAGAYGGKISGAGGGGFLVVYAPLDKKDSVRKALKELREVPFRFELEGSKVIFNA